MKGKEGFDEVILPPSAGSHLSFSPFGRSSDALAILDSAFEYNVSTFQLSLIMHSRFKVGYSVQIFIICERPAPFLAVVWTLGVIISLDEDTSKQNNIQSFQYSASYLWHGKRESNSACMLKLQGKWETEL